jgi:DNA-binding GntR family transcriptional regulator
VVEITPETVGELVEVRALLEASTPSWRRSARSRDRRAAQDTLARGNAAARNGTSEELAHLNAEFHERLGEASRNSVLSEVMRGLRERTSIAFAINGRTRAREDWDEHAGILAAVIAGDAELAALLANPPTSQNAAAAFATNRQNLLSTAAH